MVKAIEEFRSENYDNRKISSIDQQIDTLVFHYTGMKSFNDALGRLCDPTSKVSSHFLIDEGGKIYRLMEDKYRAWHAGRSYWRGEEDINSFSLGIELVNPGHDFFYSEFPDSQINSLIELCNELIGKYNISEKKVVGHSDIAPGRKKDPGELFPWRQLASYGIGIWPDDDIPFSSNNSFWKNIALIGYIQPGQNLSDGKGISPNIKPSDIVIGFQRHFMPNHITGIVDEETLKMSSKVAKCFCS